MVQQVRFNAPAPVRTAGTIAAHLTAAKIADARRRAIAANRGVALIGSNVATTDWTALDPFGPINAKRGSTVRIARWTTAYAAHVTVYGLPHGTVYVPCYLCGEIFDAWHLDGEHVGGRLIRGTYAGGLLLCCSPCNRSKGDTGAIAHQSRDKVARLTAHVGYAVASHRDSNGARQFFHARPRRK